MESPGRANIRKRLQVRACRFNPGGADEGGDGDRYGPDPAGAATTVGRLPALRWLVAIQGSPERPPGGDHRPQSAPGGKSRPRLAGMPA